MADQAKSVPDNVGGDFFVDTTCINCDTCRQLAPKTFADQGEYSFVFHQPEGSDQERLATRALLCCPTGSIGTRGTNLSKIVRDDLPLQLAEGVYYCGFNSPKSYGGNSYLVVHPDGNWLVDSPKFLPHLVTEFEKLGGIKYVFLTHRDDVADAGQYASRFGASRIIHEGDQQSCAGAELVLKGNDATQIHPEFVIVPTPGHTRGHAVLLVRNTFLFTGDHLAYDREARRLTAFRRHCWYSWEEQTESMARLCQYRFEWVLAGHGDRVQLPRDEMAGQLEQLVQRMRLPAHAWAADD